MSTPLGRRKEKDQEWFPFSNLPRRDVDVDGSAEEAYSFWVMWRKVEDVVFVRVRTVSLSSN